jgi:uncharacterized RDD family membrane protein YckC
MSDGVLLAGRLRRLVATFVDAILVPSLTLFLVMITGTVEDAEDFITRWWALQVLLLAVVSYLLLNGYGLMRSGQTLGKMLMGIMIVSADTSGASRADLVPAPFWKLVFVRALFFPILFIVVVPWFALLPLLDQMFIFSKRRRCLHDLVCGTIVVRLES